MANQTATMISERAVIACLLRDPDEFDGVVHDGLTSEHFQDEATQRIFRAMDSLYRENGSFGQVTLSHRLPDLSGTILALMTEEYTGSLAYHSDMLHRSRRRVAALTAFQQVAGRLSQTALSDDFDLEGALDEIARMTKGADTQTQRYVSTTDALAKLESNIELRRKGTFGLPTGMPTIDALLNGGLQPSCMYVVGGRPGDGKTTLAWQIALESSYVAPVAYVTVEMTADDLAASAVSYIAEVDSQAVRNGIHPLWENEIATAKRTFASMPLYVHESNGDFERVLLECRRMVRRQNVQLVVVDYVQLMQTPGFKSKPDMLGHISPALKQFALKHKVAVVVCAQLNRSIEARGENAEPRLSDLRDSGAIEQDADAVLFIQRSTKESAKCAVDIHLAKNRRGRTRKVAAAGDYAIGKIREV